MNATIAARNNSIERYEVIRQANRLWRRAGVSGTDRKLLLAELETELSGAAQDGHSLTAVLGEDSAEMLQSWADERGMSGRAVRLGLIIPAALGGIVAGLAVIIVALVDGFTGSSNFDPGSFILPLYATAGLLGYLCALLAVSTVLRTFGDPRASSTTHWLAALLPVGAALSGSVGFVIAWSRNFSTSPKVFLAVIGVVVVGLALTVTLSRYLSVRAPRETESESDHN